MKIDPQVSALLTAIEAAGRPTVDKLPVDFARDIIETGYAQMNCPVKDVFSIENRNIQTSGGDLPIRIYKPSGKESLPVLLFIHGGGWVLFQLDAYDSICTHLCAEAACIVVSVDYRRSPEYKFPSALDDCMDAVQWVVDNAQSFGGDPANIIVAGDSAGGNLAASVALRLRNEEGPKIAGQVLIYPVTNYLEPPTPSMKEFAEGYSLTYDAMKWFWGHYLENISDAKHPYVSPLKADDLSHLPDALVLVSGFDPLCDEGVDYANRLNEAGCKVTLSRYDDMIHGFLSYLGYIDRANVAITEICSWLQDRFEIPKKK